MKTIYVGLVHLFCQSTVSLVTPHVLEHGGIPYQQPCPRLGSEDKIILVNNQF